MKVAESIRTQITSPVGDHISQYWAGTIREFFIIQPEMRVNAILGEKIII